jgi:hypothetical protein
MLFLTLSANYTAVYLIIIVSAIIICCSSSVQQVTVVENGQISPFDGAIVISLGFVILAILSSMYRTAER